MNNNRVRRSIALKEGQFFPPPNFSVLPSAIFGQNDTRTLSSHQQKPPITSADYLANKDRSRTNPNSLTHKMNRLNEAAALEIQLANKPPSRGSSSKGAHPQPESRVILVDSPNNPNIPICYRSHDEKSANPDRLSLDRRDLTVCPILEGEENLRLLNYQHNSITKIQHLTPFRKLIFLDLYDNQIEQINGLSTLKSLRVLMLGKNKISKIEGLDAVVKLDVLDLHGNDISEIENLSHLSELRVLNLASNNIEVVRNLTGMNSLTELNLRRNKIHSVFEVDSLPSLQRLFLSYNEIASWSSIECLGFSQSLAEITMDGTPFSMQQQQYRSCIITNMQFVKQLDLKRVSEEERRILMALAKKEQDRLKDSQNGISLKERKRIAISNAQKQFEGSGRSKRSNTLLRSNSGNNEVVATFVANRPVSASLSQSFSVSSSRPSSAASTNRGSRPNSSRPNSGRTLRSLSPVMTNGPGGLIGPLRSPSNESQAKNALNNNQYTTVIDSGLSSIGCEDEDEKLLESKRSANKTIVNTSTANVSSLLASDNSELDHLAEVSSETLSLYGTASLDSLDKSLGIQAAGQVTTVVFKYMDFNDITRYLHKLRARLPAVHTLMFHSVNLCQLHQLNSLLAMRKLDHLFIEEREENPLTKFKLWKLYAIFRLCPTLKLKRINDKEIDSTDMFNADKIFQKIAHYSLKQNCSAHLSILVDDVKKKLTPQEMKSNSLETLGVVALTYNPLEIVRTRECKEQSKKELANAFLSESLSESLMLDKKRLLVGEALPAAVFELVVHCADTLKDRKAYMKECMQNFLKTYRP